MRSLMQHSHTMAAGQKRSVTDGCYPVKLGTLSL